jgi:hypothetical protein
MVDIRAQLDEIYGDSAVTHDGDSVQIADPSVLYSIIEQLVTRIEELESRLS